MSTVTPRRMLIYNIQKRLSGLSISHLMTVASSVEDGGVVRSVDHLSEPELYDLIVDYLRSDKLKTLEDEGMAQLLLLDDMLSDLLTTDTEEVEASQGMPPATGAVMTNLQGCSTPPPPDYNHSDQPPATPAVDIPIPSLNLNSDTPILPPSLPDRNACPAEGDRDPHSLPSLARRSSSVPPTYPSSTASVKSPTAGVIGASLGGVSQSSSVGDQVLRLTDVTALLPRREFKLHGGQITDVGSDMSYSNLCQQMDEGLQEGFTESEVIRTVIRIVKPGAFREMFTHKGGLTVNELKRFLCAHIRDKNSTELFQELSNAKQQDKESPQQFLYRIMGLKQRVLFESQQPDAEFSYDKKLVQGTFLHTLYQGLNEKSTHVRHDLKPLLTELQVTDDFLLDQITKSTSEEAERLKRLGTVAKTRPVTVSTAQLDSSDPAKQVKVDTELQANRSAIKELTAQVSSLTKHLAQMVKPFDNMTPVNLCKPVAHPPVPTAETRGRCSDCVQQSKVNCPHCFACGQAGHRAIGCLQKKMSGNGVRSLERGSQ
ncbi:uncharacterized protein LOC117507524 [Thalassophryne amazonica]|uniref:uncharacterized protein LOC117507524 n=1 Tax=Thalassophryne amazonica TaxID=390379 RepID=UPI001471E28D|nr:uncharacterized protein LOC117507524 [Thalassophryne amazonica]XP_034023285.1 uncharacterized protein LOC117507524 [Thalassophryne amazonica]